VWSGHSAASKALRASQQPGYRLVTTTHFTDAHLVVVKLASPLLHAQLVAEAEIRREMGVDDAAWLNRLVFGIVADFLVLVLIVQVMTQKLIT
jgi:hypothetical protein